MFSAPQLSIALEGSSPHLSDDNMPYQRENSEELSQIRKCSEEQIRERGVRQASYIQPKFVLSVNILLSLIKPSESILALCRDGGVGYRMLPQLPFVIGPWPKEGCQLDLVASCQVRLAGF